MSVIGADAAAKLAAMFGAPVVLGMPSAATQRKAERDAAILAATTATQAELAALHGLSERHVQRIIAASAAASPPASVAATTERKHMSNFKEWCD